MKIGSGDANAGSGAAALAVAPAANATKVARLRVLHGCCSPHAATVAPM